MPECRDARIAVLCEDRRHYHLLIPARSIETWLYLIEHETPVDEATDYKPRCPGDEPEKLGRRWRRAVRVWPFVLFTCAGMASESTRISPLGYLRPYVHHV